MTLTANRESINENASPKKFKSYVNPKDFTRKQTQAITPIKMQFNLIDNSEDFFLQICKKKPGDSSVNWKTQRDYQTQKASFKFDSNLNRKVWVLRRSDKWGRDEVAEIDLKLVFWSDEKNRWAEATLSSMNWNPVLVKKNQVHCNKTQLNRNQHPATKKLRWRSLRRTSQ